MSKADKPIFSQPGGRGKLYASVSGRSYEGTYLLPSGKFDRRIFKQPSNAKAIAAYTEWCAGMDERIMREMADAVRPGRSKDAAAAKAPTGEIETSEEKKMPTANGEKPYHGSLSLSNIYVVMVVGGVAVAWCETFDKAAAVCDALTLGAKASGFAAKYDVVEVKKWTA